MPIFYVDNHACFLTNLFGGISAASLLGVIPSREAKMMMMLF